jgi:hypothetical protein
MAVGIVPGLIAISLLALGVMVDRRARRRGQRARIDEGKVRDRYEIRDPGSGPGL